VLSRLILLTLWLALSLPSLAAPLDRGYQALDKGDYAAALTEFDEVSGEPGQIARARLALVLGRPEKALEELRGTGVACQVTRLEALIDASEFNRAQDLVQSLEALKHSELPPPYDTRFYWQRGRFQAAASHSKLARKNFLEALRRTEDPNLILGIKGDLLGLALKVDDIEQAQKIHETTIAWVDKVTSVDALGHHLLVSASIQRSLGQAASEAALIRASRELYLNHNNPVRAARALLMSSHIHERRGDEEMAYRAARRALDEVLACGDDEALSTALDAVVELRFNRGVTKSAEVGEIYKRTISELPEGRAKQEIRLDYGQALESLLTDPEELSEFYQQFLETSQSDLNRCLAHQSLARVYKKAGRYAQAAAHLDKALKLARPTLRRDRASRAHPCLILLTQSGLARSQHNYSEALTRARQAIESANGLDWAGFRMAAHQQALQISLDTYDLAAAKRQYRSAFEEFDKLAEISSPKSRAQRVTYLVESLHINRSVDQDVLDPAESALGDYGELASALLEDAFEDPETIEGVLDCYDSQLKQIQLRKAHLQEASPHLNKAVFLEALGRLPEARASLQTSIRLSQTHGPLWVEVWARFMLARVERREGNVEASLREITQSATLSLKMNPSAARFYHMLAGSAQRQGGQLKQALASFDQVIELYPEQSWAAHYGRGLVHEELGQTQLALADFERASELVGQRGLTSRSVIKGALGRVLLAAKRNDEGLTKLEEAHQELLTHGSASSLTTVTLDYVRALEERRPGAQALEVIQQSLARLQEWQTTEGLERICQAGVTLSLSQERPREALRFLQLSQSASLMASVDLSRIRHHDAETEQLLREVQQLKTRITRLQEQSGKSSDKIQRSSLGRIQTETREQFFSRLNDLRQRDADFEALVQLGGSELSAVQGLLSPEDVLVEYFPSEHSLHLFVVTQSDLTIHEVFISRKELEGLVDGFLLSVSRPDTPPSSYQPMARSLYELLMSPVGAPLTSAKNLHIVPSGPLWRVPFAALINPDGRTLHQDLEISYVTSADIMRVIASRDRATTAPSQPLLVSGSEDLKGARIEVLSLAQLWTEAKTLGPQEADFKSLQESVGGRDLLHIASHSVLHPEPEKTYIKLGADRLRLEQIYGLKLQPGSLVFLSSCQSAVGERNPGKEVTSLASAFSIAGASTVVASRWRIDDTATVDIVSAFYQALLEGKSRGEALRFAELQAAKKRSHPYYWAGFSLFGDPD
jgi:CHAT domain-containing protein